MKEIAVSQRWLDHYDSCYKEENGTMDKVAAWRDLLALDTARDMITCCNSIPHDTILEVGCGLGSLLRQLDDLQFAKQLYGLEIARGAVERTIEKNINTLAECLLFDGSTIPYENKTFDLAVMAHVVEHLEHPRRLMREAARVANHVFITVPLEDAAFRQRQDDRYLEDGGHINLYSYKSFRLLIQTCDLKIVSQIVTVPSAKAYRFSMGRKGIFAPITMKFCLKTVPSIALAMFDTYRSAILCKSAP
jgi:ubiquinone/menaquinone biosynthesis C-methylase UbiE